MPQTTTQPDFAALLEQAITQPGIIHEGYSRFWNYSLGNQLLALAQCAERGLQPGPLATFPKWKELGRHVRRGEKALSLIQPWTCSRTVQGTDDRGNTTDEQTHIKRFYLRPRWFMLTQTDGADYQPEPLPDWNADRALTALNIARVAFDVIDGNASSDTATSRRARRTDAEPSDREVEAEAVAYLCCAALNLAGSEYSARLPAALSPPWWAAHGAHRATRVHDRRPDSQGRQRGPDP